MKLPAYIAQNFIVFLFEPLPDECLLAFFIHSSVDFILPSAVVAVVLFL